ERLMDFRPTDDQVTVRDLARSVFERHADPLRLPGIEESEQCLDAELWNDLAASGVLGLVVPDEHGGAGLGPYEFAGVLTEQGRALGTVPLWETVVAGALPLVRYGTEKQQTE